MILPWDRFILRLAKENWLLSPWHPQQLASTAPELKPAPSRAVSPRDGINEINFVGCFSPFLWFTPRLNYTSSLPWHKINFELYCGILPPGPSSFLPESSRASRPKHLYKKASPHPPDGLPGHSTPLQPWQQSWKRRGAGPTSVNLMIRGVSTALLKPLLWSSHVRLLG